MAARSEVTGIADNVLPWLKVSRETEERLNTFLNGVAKWTARINLVSRGTVADLRSRHLSDSAQLFAHLGAYDRTWADLGSGGGFPGIVIAILAHELRPDLVVTLIESDRRKATFLRMIVAELGLNTIVLSARIEDVPGLGADVVSARALAPLDVLLGLAERHLAPDGVALFLKGETHQVEIESARRSWRFDLKQIVSITQANAALLKIKDIRRV